ncbi:hypothetical protein DYH10_01145 [Candidatus Saccharibacteria bacterium CPR2]|nr:hypothetical protein [Candidatus Saccharibacteria bacterium CPR2]
MPHSQEQLTNPETIESQNTNPQGLEHSPTMLLLNEIGQDPATEPMTDIMNDSFQEQEKKFLGQVAIDRAINGAKKVGKWLTSPSDPEKAQQDKEYFDNLLYVARSRVESKLTDNDYPELTLAPETRYQQRAHRRLEKDTEKLAKAKEYERWANVGRSEKSGPVKRIETWKARRAITKSAREKFRKGEISHRELKKAKDQATRTWITTGEDFVQKRARKRREKTERALVKTTVLARGRRMGEPLWTKQEGFVGISPVDVTIRSKTPNERHRGDDIPIQEKHNQEVATRITKTEVANHRRKNKPRLVYSSHPPHNTDETGYSR